MPLAQGWRPYLLNMVAMEMIRAFAPTMFSNDRSLKVQAFGVEPSAREGIT